MEQRCHEKAASISLLGDSSVGYRRDTSRQGDSSYYRRVSDLVDERQELRQSL